jgi:hypothetical protein
MAQIAKKITRLFIKSWLRGVLKAFSLNTLTGSGRNSFLRHFAGPIQRPNTWRGSNETPELQIGSHMTVASYYAVAGRTD